MSSDYCQYGQPHKDVLQQNKYMTTVYLSLDISCIYTTSTKDTIPSQQMIGTATINLGTTQPFQIVFKAT